MASLSVRILACFHLASYLDMCAQGTENLALNKTANASSVFLTDTPNYAVDGNRGGDLVDDKCAHTEEDFQAWWEVDLGEIYEIGSVQLFNRVDCCWERLSDFRVLLGTDQAVYTECFHLVGQLGKGPKNVTCTAPTPAQYVKIQLDGTGYLTLCEVEVYLTDPVIITSTTIIPDVTSSKVNPAQTSSTENIGESDTSFLLTSEPISESTLDIDSSSTDVGGLDVTSSVSDTMVATTYGENLISGSTPEAVSDLSSNINSQYIPPTSTAGLLLPITSESVDITNTHLQDSSSHWTGQISSFHETGTFDLTPTPTVFDSTSAEQHFSATLTNTALESSDLQEWTTGGLSATDTSLPDASTSTYDPYPPLITREVCACRCVQPNVPTNVIMATRNAIALKQELTLNTKNLSSTIRSKTSAENKLVRSKYIGSLGICMLSFTFIIIVFFDLVNFCNFLYTRGRRR